MDITVLDRRNHHLFQPLLYQVATAALSPGDIAAPIRRILRRQSNATVVLGEVVGIDLGAHEVQTPQGRHHFDYLIVSPGASHSYFGRNDWEPLAPGLKTVEDALEIRRRMLLAYEAAEICEDESERQRLLTFVVVGGGPTGVEMAGAMAEIARHTLARDFRRIKPTQARFVLIEAMDRVLPTFPQKLSASARRLLERLGVEVLTGKMVKEIDEVGVSLDGDRIESRTVIWAAGVQASPLGALLGAPTDRNGRVMVEGDLSIPGHDEVFVAGDLAHFEQDGEPVPGMAPGAIQEGRHAARNIIRAVEGKPPLLFRYRDKGHLATIGRAAAVARIGRLEFSGLPAWILWVIVHIFYLIGFRNRYIVLAEWAWEYFTWDKGARLITGRPPGWKNM